MIVILDLEHDVPKPAVPSRKQILQPTEDQVNEEICFHSRYVSLMNGGGDGENLRKGRMSQGGEYFWPNPEAGWWQQPASHLRWPLCHAVVKRGVGIMMMSDGVVAALNSLTGILKVRRILRT